MMYPDKVFADPRKRALLERIDRNHDKAQRRIADATGDHFAGREQCQRDRLRKIERVCNA